MVIGQDGKARAAGQVPFRDPSPYRFGPMVKFPIRTAFEMTVALNFERDIVGPALGALQKAVVESGHGSWGILQERAEGRSVPATGSRRMHPSARGDTFQEIGTTTVSLFV